MKTKDILKKRDWVKRHEKNFGVLTNEINKRTKVLKDKLWGSKEEDIFDILTFSILGVFPLNFALLTVVSSIFDKEDKRDFEVKANEIINFLFAINTLLYLERNEKDQYPVVVYKKINEVPIGYIHILDLTPVELSKELDKAIQAHGHKKRMSFVLDYINKMPELPEIKPIKKDDELYDESISQKYKFLAYLKKSKEKFSKKEEEKINKIIGVLTSPDVIRGMQSEIATFEEAYDKSIPNHSKHEAEIVKTTNKIGIEALNLTQLKAQENNIEKASGDKIKVGFEKKIYNDILKTIAKKPVRAKMDYDLVFNSVNDILNRRRDVQKAHKKYKRDTGSLLAECKKKYPNITLSIITEDCKFESRNLTHALIETSKKLKMGVQYCRDLFKLARKNHNVNKIWAKYLKLAEIPKIDIPS